MCCALPASRSGPSPVKCTSAEDAAMAFVLARFSRRVMGDSSSRGGDLAKQFSNFLGKRNSLALFRDLGIRGRRADRGRTCISVSASRTSNVSRLFR
jgi:hypothetical protein